MKVLIDIDKEDLNKIRRWRDKRDTLYSLSGIDRINLSANSLDAVANGLEIDDKIYSELIDKEYQYINKQEDLGMELLNALAGNKALKEAIEKIRTEIDSLERFELKGEKTPLINGDNVLQIIDKYKAESED